MPPYQCRKCVKKGTKRCGQPKGNFKIIMCQEYKWNEIPYYNRDEEDRRCSACIECGTLIEERMWYLADRIHYCPKCKVNREFYLLTLEEDGINPSRRYL